ncbi:hypothetical protein HNP38_000376 [Chryseobacterium defluvii]|uniref:Uncharacterized protein n=1 Tax=Chryseobacterium defluvii TaxID=160396 RepID=A0A840KBB5_9FLAO|nr:hypothetical protein [Chryseobacterium defluvii]MBB4805104.1 hypothetical protein [Chryseobacterium defluvii]
MPCIHKGKYSYWSWMTFFPDIHRFSSCPATGMTSIQSDAGKIKFPFIFLTKETKISAGG